MYTASYVDSQIKALKGQGISKADIIRHLTGYCQGWPYVFGAAGEMCTPAKRSSYAGSRPDHAAAIRSACPVLSGKQPACDGCKWVDARIYDCRGFTRWLLLQVGIYIYGGTVTAQWETESNWVAKGTDINAMPHGLVCCVFRPSHTGMYVGNDTVRHCGGKKGQAVEEKLPGTPHWERWAIPAGLYTNAELEAAGVKFDPAKNIPTLRRGSNCDEVEELQVLLNAKYGANLEIDGSFGAKTEAAVKAFQQAKGLTADGVVGPKTRAALGLAFAQDTNTSGNVSTGETPAPRPLDTQGIWDKLMIVVNGNPYAAAGIMGNMYAESSLIPNNLQGNGNKALSMTDEEYTAAVDSGAYTAEQFASDGFGYGLCQWTYKTRKASLLQCAKQYGLSIGDEQAQIIFLLEELKSSFLATWEKLLAAKSVREASDAFMLGFEKPKNQSEENQARRAALGQRYFDRFASATSSEDYVSIPRLKAMELKALLVTLIQTAQKVLNEVETALNGGEGN